MPRLWQDQGEAPFLVRVLTDSGERKFHLIRLDC